MAVIAGGDSVMSKIRVVSGLIVNGAGEFVISCYRICFVSLHFFVYSMKIGQLIFLGRGDQILEQHE